MSTLSAVYLQNEYDLYGVSAQLADKSIIASAIYTDASENYKYHLAYYNTKNYHQCIEDDSKSFYMPSYSADLAANNQFFSAYNAPTWFNTIPFQERHKYLVENTANTSPFSFTNDFTAYMNTYFDQLEMSLGGSYISIKGNVCKLHIQASITANDKGTANESFHNSKPLIKLASSVITYKSIQHASQYFIGMKRHYIIKWAFRRRSAS